MVGPAVVLHRRGPACGGGARLGAHQGADAGVWKPHRACVVNGVLRRWGCGEGADGVLEVPEVHSLGKVCAVGVG
jgi:hypothetical protein